MTDRVQERYEYFVERWERLAFEYRENRTHGMLNDGCKQRPPVPMPDDEFIMALAIEAVERGE